MVCMLCMYVCSRREQSSRQRWERNYMREEADAGRGRLGLALIMSWYLVSGKARMKFGIRGETATTTMSLRGRSVLMGGGGAPGGCDSALGVI